MSKGYYTWARERYKNDPDYLEILKEKNREACKKRYDKKKEKKNDSTGNSADSDSVSGRGCVSCDNNSSDKGLSERTFRAADSSSEGGTKTESL